VESTYLVLAVHSIASAAAAQATTRPAHRTVVTPAGTPLSIRAITSHVAGIAADTADNVGGEVLPLGTIVLAVPDLATVLACLVLVVTESPVQGGKLAQLVALELILAFGDRRGLVT
jgi:hypothetical protein